MSKQDWSKNFQKQVRTLAKEVGLVGLNVINNGGRVQIKIRKSEGKKVINQETVMIPFLWAEQYSGDAYTRVRNAVSICSSVLKPRTSAGSFPKEITIDSTELVIR